MTIELTRDDLQRELKEKPFDEIIYTDFKPNILSKEDYHKADFVIFSGEGYMKFLKNRFIFKM